MQQAAAQLHADDNIWAFLDDIYVIATKERAAEALMVVSDAVEDIAGVRPHLGKLEAWSRAGGDEPPGLQAISSTAWRGDRLPHENGITVLGVPVGTEQFVEAKLHERLEEEAAFLDLLPARASAGIFR